MRQFVKGILQKFGLDLVSYPYFHDKQRLELFRRFDVQTFVDIGANAGQYATHLWNLGFDGTIISFEPVKATYGKLAANAAKRKNWITHNMAFGDVEGESVINVTENTLSSSLLPPLEVFLSTTPEAKVVSQEKVRVLTLDSWTHELFKYKKNHFLKIDAQGYERKILDGAGTSLSGFAGIQIELSLKSLYGGEETFFELFPALQAKGFKLYEIENGYRNPVNGEALQLELILFRND